MNYADRVPISANVFQPAYNCFVFRFTDKSSVKFSHNYITRTLQDNVRTHTSREVESFKPRC